MATLRNEIAEKLRDVLDMVMGSESEALKTCTEQSRLVEDLGLTSVGVLYIAIGIEESFGIRFDDVGFGDFKTVGDVIDYIEKKAE